MPLPLTSDPHTPTFEVEQIFFTLGFTGVWEGGFINTSRIFLFLYFIIIYRYHIMACYISSYRTHIYLSFYVWVGTIHYGVLMFLSINLNIHLLSSNMISLLFIYSYYNVYSRVLYLPMLLSSIFNHHFHMDPKFPVHISFTNCLTITFHKIRCTYSHVLFKNTQFISNSTIRSPLYQKVYNHHLHHI